MHEQGSHHRASSRPTARLPLFLFGVLLLAAVAFLRAGRPAAGITAAPAGSYIVQAGSASAARQLVQGVGGHVTRELGLIDAVAARLSPAQEARLAASAGARVYADRPLELGTAPIVVTARDLFDQVAFSNNDGSLAWAGDWQEIGESDGVLLGDIRVASGMLSLRDEGSGVRRAADLSGAAAASLSFNARRKSFDDASDYFAVEVSIDDGASWTELARLAGPANDNAPQAYGFDLSAYVGHVVHLRIGASGSIDKREALTLDSLALDVVYTEAAPPPPGGNLAYNQLIDADPLHDDDLLGAGVTVAIVDTGFWLHPALLKDPAGQPRVVAQYDAMTGALVVPAQLTTDGSGHGAHLASIIANSDTPVDGFAGVAPGVSLFPVRAFDENGAGSYVDVIAALEAVVAYKETYNIRVVNLSFSAPPMSYYWDDPLNQAVMAAWQAGIVVVAAAGNGGPDPMTVGVPGNVPYVITVGAMTDSYTPSDASDDVLASFSAAGPTVEGFIKPELLAPGGHIAGLVSPFAQLATSYPEYQLAGNYFMMSGTSQATAVVSGVAALMLAQEPALSPDDVKCRLMASAHPALDAQSELAYSVFQQGAGMVNAADAVDSTETGCANQGLDVALDLSGEQHFGGPANLDADGNYVLVDADGNPLLDGFAWSGSFMPPDATMWDADYNWLDGFAWSGGAFVGDNYIWSTAWSWDENYTWSNSFMTLNGWVPQE